MTTINYTITPINPSAHLFEVTLTIAKPDPNDQVVSLPAWIPGSYMIRDFAKNIVEIAAFSDGKPLALTKLDKQSWSCAPCSGPLTLRYSVYAWDLSVRSAHLDTTHGYFNGTSVFLACARPGPPPLLGGDRTAGGTLRRSMACRHCDSQGKHP